MTAPVIIEDYDPRWPKEFEILRSRIDAVLGPLAAAIEHIGSTAVPGLAAKPIIDIDVLLRSADELPAAVGVLATLGYQHQGDLGIAGREAFKAPADAFPHHLYVCPHGSAEFRRHVIFRDYLRSHSPRAQAYADLKKRLAALHNSDRDAYTAGKTCFIEEALQRCQANPG